ncbi:MAG: hypothetical protein NWF10_00660 [Candidatus Bathyarchaeota archaeon]|nr:hypothetical protein [Candidatus Bathyarchaeota archaeon]
MNLLVVILSFVQSFGILYSTRWYLARGRLSSGDTFFHLLVIESIRKHRWNFPSSLQNVVFSEIDKNSDYLAYPPLIHYVVALFPPKFHQKIAKYFSLVILSFVSSIAGIFTYDLTLNLGLAMLSSFIVIFNFSTLSPVFKFSPRPLGLFFYSLIVCIAVFYPETLFSLLTIAFLVMLISLTHKFALQTLLFGFMPYVFLFGKPYFLLSFLLGILLSIFISRGFFLRILKEHISWLRFFKSRPKRIRIIPYLTAIFGRNIWVLIILISILFGFFLNNGSLLENLLKTDLFTKVVFWGFINLLIALLVSIPALSFLGQNYRYVEYSVVPIGIATSLLAVYLTPYIWFASFACISISLLALLKYRKHLVHSKTLVDPDDILSYYSLRDYNFSNLLVFPGSRTLEVSYYSGISVIHPVRGPKTPVGHITNLTKNYGIRYILRFKGNDRYQLFATMLKMIKMKKILDLNTFELYQVIQENGLDIPDHSS